MFRSQYQKELFTLNLSPKNKVEPIERVTVHPDPWLHFISQFMQNPKLFSFLVNILTSYAFWSYLKKSGAQFILIACQIYVALSLQQTKFNRMYISIFFFLWFTTIFSSGVLIVVLGEVISLYAHT